MANKKKLIVLLAERTVQFSVFQVVTPLVTWPMNTELVTQTKINTEQLPVCYLTYHLFGHKK